MNTTRSFLLLLLSVCSSCSPSSENSSQSAETTDETRTPENSATAFRTSSVESLARLLTSPISSDRQMGETQLHRQNAELYENLLHKLMHGALREKASSARLLRILISPWARGSEASRYHPPILYTPHRPVERSASHARAEEVRKAVRSSLKFLLATRQYKNSSAPGGNRVLSSSFLNAVWQTSLLLVEVADSASANEVASILSTEKDQSICSALMYSLDMLHGLPPSFVARGNYSTREFQEREKQRLADAKQHVLRWHDEHRIGSEESLASAVSEWSQWLERADLYETRGSVSSVQPIIQDMEPLVRLGSAVLPLIEKARDQAKDLLVEARYEMVLAAITGTASKIFVRKLIAGDFTQQVLGCQIIATAGAAGWMDALEKIAVDSREWWDPRQESLYALAVCHKEAALPVLKRVKTDNPVIQDTVIRVIDALELVMSRAKQRERLQRERRPSE